MTITVDQETNYVTFVMNNKGVVPVWIFGDQKIDGKASKKYSYTDNNVTLRFREAGEHTVEVKAYNANGISQGSLVKTFTMDNTYRDPFDPSPYVKAISTAQRPGTSPAALPATRRAGGRSSPTARRVSSMTI